MTPTVHGSEFAQLRAFVSVAEHASFSRAAEQLGITPSSLSQTIRNLEERLSLRLFNRTTRSVALTPAGDALYSASALPWTRSQRHWRTHRISGTALPGASGFTPPG
ncbi:LysR family transcriptional regulator [Novosphingobium panipatense]|uniref:LysR family transcriptional regulator n=1 Tax=Novosphingobium panipatense TaxID=428991 RepID=UPI00360D29BB